MVAPAELLAFIQIVLIDMSLAGDNAIAVGMAVSGLPGKDRRRAMLAGIAAATVLRIVFAIFAVEIMRVTGLLAAGGLLLLWVAWKMYRDIRSVEKKAKAHKQAKKLSDAITQIAIADISMSLDNVLGVAGVARDHMGVLAAGLVLSVLLMAVAATFIAKLTERYPWIAYLGLVIVLYTSLNMIWDGSQQLLVKG